MIGYETFASCAVDIRDRLGRHLADEAGQDFLHVAIRARWQGEAQARIDQWMRNPKEPESDTERLCEEARLNHQAMEKARAERSEGRKALREAQEAQDAPDPTIATLSLRDALTGQIWAITLLAESVARVVTNRLTV